MDTLAGDSSSKRCSAFSHPKLEEPAALFREKMVEKESVVIWDFSEKMELFAEASKVIRREGKHQSRKRAKQRENPLKRKYRWYR